MDLNQGMGEVEKLFKKGLSARDLLVIAANYRRIELEESLCNIVGNKIIDGPFKGCIQPRQAHASVLCPKILGTYEKEISQDLRDLVAGKDCFIDIGCAEGYYTTGVGATTDIPLVLGVDISEKALEQARMSSESNGISAKTLFFLDLSEAVRLAKGKTLVMIDVDGSEIEVIDQLFSSMSASQALSMELIIETDFNSDGSCNAAEIESALQDQNFVVSKVIKQSILNRFSPASERITKSYLDLLVLGLEGRPLDQGWLIAKPRH